MGSLFNLFKRKKSSLVQEITVPQPKESGYLCFAECIANVVSAGVENENYKGIIQGLSSFANDNSSKEVYVFKYPSVFWKRISIFIMACISLLLFYIDFIAVMTICFSTSYLAFSLCALIIASVGLVVNLRLIRKFGNSIKQKKRYDVYYDYLVHRSFAYIDNLAQLADQTKAVVIQDLQDAIQQKLVPQGHFSNNKIVYITSDKVYGQYLERHSVYDYYFEKYLEKTIQQQSLDEKTKELHDSCEQTLMRLSECCSRIKDKSVTDEVVKLTRISSMIFQEIDGDPVKMRKLGRFLRYYLPTTEKLILAYVAILEKSGTSKKAAEIKKEIEEVLHTITMAYETVLEQLFSEYELEISSDIAALEMKMRMDGLLQ